MKYVLYVFLLLMTFFTLPEKGMAAVSDSAVIHQGVYAQDISLGGMTEEEAIQAINSYFQPIADSYLTLTCSDQQKEKILVSSLDFQWDAKQTAEDALLLGNEGSLIKRYKSQMNLKYGNIYLETSYHISPDAVKTTLEELSELHDNPAENAVLSREHGEFTVVSQESEGIVTEMDATLQQISDLFANHLGTTMELEAVTRQDFPTVTTEALSDIQDSLGTFTTFYENSTSNRKTNIRVATNFLNGTVLMPGESLSTSDAIRPREEENGYKMASQYSNGESEQDIGGGVCQVSTTLYNALLRAELQIDERYPHSMVVTYVDYGDDAAIAADTKDLVFTNNLDYPIYIEGLANGESLTFTIYGKETRPSNRQVKYIAETTFLEWPQDRNIQYTSQLASGEKEVVGTLRPEVTATLTKVIYIDGVETERILLHTDYYAASKETLLYGTG
ncbi:MAG: VanW family protein [Clostridiales bacterium]|nr:VanW family protein [Clostridiales bacterium]